MPYTPQTWVDNNASYPLSAARMNTIESGISTAASTADQGHRILTTTQRDALTGVTAGTMIYNSTLGQVQIWSGSAWLESANTANANALPNVLAPVTSAWTSWTPTLTQGVSVAITSNSSAYLKIGSIAFVRCSFTVNGTGTAGSVIYITLPAALATSTGYNAYGAIGTGTFYNGSRYPFLLQRNASATQMRLKPTTSTADDQLGNTIFTGSVAAPNQFDFVGSWEVTP